MISVPGGYDRCINVVIELKVNCFEMKSNNSNMQLELHITHLLLPVLLNPHVQRSQT